MYEMKTVTLSVAQRIRRLFFGIASSIFLYGLFWLISLAVEETIAFNKLCNTSFGIPISLMTIMSLLALVEIPFLIGIAIYTLKTAIKGTDEELDENSN